MVVGRARSPGLRGTERGAGERGQLANDGEAERVGERGDPVRGHGLGGHRVVPFKVVATPGTVPCGEGGLQAAGWRLKVRPARTRLGPPVPSPDSARPPRTVWFSRLTTSRSPPLRRIVASGEE